MGADLHKPLGQGERRRPRRIMHISWRAAASLAAVTVVFGLSLFSALTPLPLHGLPPNQQPAQSSDLDTKNEAASQVSSAAGMSATRPAAGANVERTVTDNGTVVTKYSPKARGGSGPLLIDTPRVGQDPRMAATPNELLLEDSPQGRLPTVGPDGLRPVDQYARPWSGARGTRIAIVVGGLGLSQTGTQRAIRELPGEITLAFAATGNSLQRWMQEARRDGHEILLQVPLEPFDYPSNDPGPGTLLTTAKPAANMAYLHEAMASITNYTGIMNYLGGKFLADANSLEPVMRDIGKRGLLFFDDGSSARSLSGQIAKAIGMPQAFADAQIDGQLDQQAILRRLDELERIALRKGSAIGVGSAFDETIDAVRQWSEEASRRGVEIVAISALAEDIQP
ncbi:divergent polysaccharide deacetylase family protein [Ciceribacter sp. RN22]|uniref:divergent polysaccharide deacetylase family protein n=1 Tax=Ciceribacter sp. RN22 TaxID=2954932 RepID=UPI002092B3E9|nr:divergent polysaccharide deacetylase family protein [Ciceribacter sp. RN22]MCO6180493.1 divergent polysaccharide deacetylase family protein [Ciceribacter sp. RN22]